MSMTGLDHGRTRWSQPGLVPEARPEELAWKQTPDRVIAAAGGGAVASAALAEHGPCPGRHYPECRIR